MAIAPTRAIPKKAIKFFCHSDKDYNWHLSQMNNNYKKMKSNNLSIEEKKGCALVLSYYTGIKETKDNKDRNNRKTNVITRFGISEKISHWSYRQDFYSVIYYLSKAISNLPLYIGYTVRCADLTEEETQNYEPGKIVTWVQWSSSKIGDKPAPFFQSKNTRFYIYSFSSRDISQFSIFSSEKEALYSPFSHFLVFKKVIEDDKYKIYMRQIEIGLYINNILWVVDNIFIQIGKIKN